MGIVFKAFWTISKRDRPPPTESALFERDALLQLISLLDTGAEEMVDRVTELFMLYSRYVDLGEKERACCHELGLFERGVSFLGLDVSTPSSPPAPSDATAGDNMVITSAEPVHPDAPPPLPPKRRMRRTWTQKQQRPLRWLRAALFKLIRACDLSSYQDEGLRGHHNPYSLSQLPLNEEVGRIVFSDSLRKVFVREIVLPSLSGPPLSLEDTYTLCCCCSWNNSIYSNGLLTILSQMMQEVATDVKPLFPLLQRLLAIDDGLQQTRVARAICHPEDGLLAAIDGLKVDNSKRAYLIIKALVVMSQGNHHVAAVLAEAPAWKDIAKWLHATLRTEVKGYRSNDDDDEFYHDNRTVRRTASAEQTLEGALDIAELTETSIGPEVSSPAAEANSSEKGAEDDPMSNIEIFD